MMIEEHRKKKGGEKEIEWEKRKEKLHEEMREGAAKRQGRACDSCLLRRELKEVEGKWKELKRGELASLEVTSLEKLIQVIRHGLRKKE